jgi:translation initiation factor IF-3
MIRISPVRVISDSGEQLGVLTIEEALAAAEARGLDLVEVAPTARPPVVKIMDYGKYKFEEAKAARAAKKKQHVIDIKEGEIPARASTTTTSTSRRATCASFWAKATRSR